MQPHNTWDYYCPYSEEASLVDLFSVMSVSKHALEQSRGKIDLIVYQLALCISDVVLLPTITLLAEGWTNLHAHLAELELQPQYSPWTANVPLRTRENQVFHVLVRPRWCTHCGIDVCVAG